MAVVMSRDRPHLSFALSLVSSEQTFDYPQQSWRFQSQYALRDYTGVYFIKLIPCTADSVSFKVTCLLFENYLKFFNILEGISHERSTCNFSLQYQHISK